MGLLSWELLGLIVGAIARFLLPNSPGGCFVTIAIGVAGAFVGGIIGVALGIGNVSGFDLTSLFLATVGAILLLLGYRALKGR